MSPPRLSRCGTWLASRAGLPAADRPGRPRHESVLEVARARLWVPARRRTPAAASGGDDVEDRPRGNRDAGLLGLEHAPLAAGDHDVAVGQPVFAAEEAVRRMAHPVACGITAC